MAEHQDLSDDQLVKEGSLKSSKNESLSTMQVKVYSPFKIYFDEPAESVSGENATGSFDILPQHHNFISLLNSCEIVIRNNQDTRRIHISGGVMHVKSDNVTIFLDV